MKKNPLIIVFISASLLLSCSNSEKATVKHFKIANAQMKDHHSYSKPDEARIKSMHLAIDVIFEKELLNCEVTYTIIKSKSAQEIIFDTRDLNIQKVVINDSIEVKNYKLGKPHELLGQSLTIPLASNSERLTIKYQTSKNAAALQWLNSQQTSSDKPFLFTQSQAILCRSWIPIQDSPSVKFTYTAEVKVPQGYLALMSATNPQAVDSSGIYKFEMNQPIPSYLMALAVGQLEFHQFDSTVGVYAEPKVIEQAVNELEDLHLMVNAAEKLYGKYLWGRFDVLILPASFPFGGMENPKLTYATPTILAGDKSLTSLIAHELAHSWSGNLVTNASWDDFWLNEGFTVYFEYRIMEEIYGKEYAQMLSLISYKELLEEINQMKQEGKSEDTHLKLQLAGRDPDEGLTSIAYDKGYFFLKFLEESVGREKFDQFLNKYFTSHAFSTITTEEFIVYAKQNLFVKNKIQFPEQDFNAWIFEAGLPEGFKVHESKKFSEVEDVLKNWLKNESNDSLLTNLNWSTYETLHFLHSLPDSIQSNELAILDRNLDLTNSNNSEIQAEWYKIGVLKDYRPINNRLEDFLLNTGRRKFLIPLYTVLKEKDAANALRIYKKARPNYHFVAYNSLDKLLGYNTSK